jgi:NTE family protein
MADRSALVLGGGGMLAGLLEAGVDLRSADLVIGTSAGANVGAQVLSGVPIEELFARQLKEPTGEIPLRLGWASCCASRRCWFGRATSARTGRA